MSACIFMRTVTGWSLKKHQVFSKSSMQDPTKELVLVGSTGRTTILNVETKTLKADVVNTSVPRKKELALLDFVGWHKSIPYRLCEVPGLSMIR